MREGEILEGRYKLIRQIGMGGMGSVWEASDLSQNRFVAIKALHEHLLEKEIVVERFLREARAALESRFSGHIIEVLDVVQQPGRVPYLVMELLVGQDLEQILESEGPLDPERAVNLIIQTCHALAEVHRQDLIHRDIKPENLFVTNLENGSEWIKLLDFGVVKFSETAVGIRSITEFGTAVGTPQYMSPEQVKGDENLDHRIDIYAAGVVLYELLTGRLPYDADTKDSVMRLIARGKLPRPRSLRPELESGLEKVVLKAMALKPRFRYQSVFELAEALEPYSGKGKVSSGGILAGGSQGVTTVTEKRSTGFFDTIWRRNRDSLMWRSKRLPRFLVRALTIVTCVAVLIVLGVHVFSRREEREPAHPRPEPQILGLTDDGGTKSQPTQDAGDQSTQDASVERDASIERPWQELYAKRLNRRLLGKALRALRPGVRHCLRSSGAPGKEIRVHFWIASDGTILYRKTRPAVSSSVARCLRRTVKTQRLAPTKIPPFVATATYTIPAR